MLVLDARNPAQVDSATVIDADLGVGGRRLIVASGIAVYGWTIDTDETARGEVRVNLGIFARELEQASPYVGLASIGADESAYVFAIDQARVDLDPATGELSLYAKTALMGEAVWFWRFGYQVVATVVRATTEISGSVTWPVGLFRPQSEDIGLVAPHLSVIANRYEQKPGGGLFPFIESLTPVTPGAIISVDIRDDVVVAKYRIDHPPMGMPLKVTANLSGPFHAQPGVSIGRIAGPEVFTLSPANPSETVDFGVSQYVVR
jgi:hypothetical protein